DATDICAKWPVDFTRRTAGVMAGFEPEVERLIVEPSADNEYFLRVGVTLAAERSRIGPRVKPRQPGVFARVRIYAKRECLRLSLKPADRRPTLLVLGGQRVPVGRHGLCHPAPRIKRAIRSSPVTDRHRSATANPKSGCAVGQEARFS